MTSRKSLGTLLALLIMVCGCIGNEPAATVNETMATTTTVAAVAECTVDSECFKKESMCADGFDPFHVCKDGACTLVLYEDDPCMNDHICPNGKWELVLDDSCFIEKSCEDTGCDDGSMETKDECINVGTKVEGCKYTRLDLDSLKNCSVDMDCAVEESTCPDGIDPYNICVQGKCQEVTAIKDLCKYNHTCPNGEWTKKDDKSCFIWKKCNDTGCDDHTRATRDECVNIGSRSEGCLYTLTTEDPKTCETDSDCVPATCCHPVACVNAENKPNCAGIMCTAVCKGPLDCGAGHCGCVDGICTINSSDGEERLVQSSEGIAELKTGASE